MKEHPIRVLLLPKFETGAMTGDFPGEAQHLYENWCLGGQEYEITGGFPGHKLYVRDRVALYVTGMGKVNAALSLQAVLLDPRFDFSRCFVISVGCAGSAWGRTVMGDVVVVTAALDYDLGHHADIRELPADTEFTWFHDPAFDGSACRFLNRDLTDRVYYLLKDMKPRTTEQTKAFMAHSFNHAPWAIREPQVIKGTTISGDNYWKGDYGRRNAEEMVRVYNCPDPFALAEMEDVALAVALDRLGMLDRYIIIRSSVNMDCFMNGHTPHSLWTHGHVIAAEDSAESADIFPTAMENNAKAVGRILDAILDGSLVPEG
jgi:purine nucleoside permease